MGKRSQKKAKAEAANAECLESSIEDVEAKGISHLPEEILLKILHFSAFNKNLKSIYQSSDFFRSLIDGSTNLKNKLALSIHSNPTWTSEYLQEVSKANTDSERKFKIARLEVGTHLPILCYQDVNSVLQKQTLLTDLTINIKMMRDAKNLRTILFGLHNNKTLKRLNVRIKSTKKNIHSDFSGISCFPSLQELSIRGSHNPSYSLFFSCQAVRVLELEGLNKPEDFDRAISLVGKLKNTLKSLSFVDVTFDQFSFAKLISLTGLQLTSLKFNDVDIKAAVGHFPQVWLNFIIF